MIVRSGPCPRCRHDAKTHLSRIIERMERGEEIIIDHIAVGSLVGRFRAMRQVLGRRYVHANHTVTLSD